MKMINRKFSFTVLVFTFLLISLFIVQTMAWISLGGDFNGHLTFGGFEVTVASKNGNTPLQFNNGVYYLNGLSPDDYNQAVDRIQNANKGYTNYENNNPFINDFNMTITIDKADIAGYLRIKILDEWVVTRRFVNFTSTNKEVAFIGGTNVEAYAVSPDWYFDANSGYYYYQKQIEKTQTPVIINFITNGISYTPIDSLYFIDTCDVTMATSIQIVQANRYQEIWGLTEYPTKPQTPAQKEVK